MNKPFCLTILIIGSLALSCANKNSKNQINMITQTPQLTKAEAVKRACNVTRLDQFSVPLAAVKRSCDNPNIPFLSETIRNRAVWEIEFNQFFIDEIKPANQRAADNHAREMKFIAHLDSQSPFVFVTGRLLGNSNEVRAAASALSAEKQLRGIKEIYLFPTNTPGITFLDALRLLGEQGIVDPTQAKEIDGCFIMHSRLGALPRHVWIINLRGLPPKSPRGGPGGKVPEWQVNHLRCAVDATSGQCLFSTNIPHPVE